MNVRAGVETLIGREHPSAVVHADITRLVESHGGLLLVTGEAGIGKTTLVSEAAEQARRRGVLVLGGSCWESARAPDYWPWVQVVRALQRATSAAEWVDIEQAAGPALATLLGEALLPTGATSQGPSIWPERAERSEVAPDAFRLADAVTTALVVAAQTRPVMVVLEDLHWADPASLHLLEFVGQHTWFERLLLAGTYRDTEVDAADGPTRSLLAPIVAKATSVTLTGLGRDDVAALISQVAGRTPPPEIVDEIHRRTGGNPFFVEQTARLWQIEGVLGAVPPGVRDAVRRRIALLPQPVADLLVAASVLGRDLDRALLASIVGREPGAVDGILDVAMAARLVAAAGPGRLAFTHDLVRETLYSGLNETERQRRHAAVVATITGNPAPTTLLPADLARHAHRAGPHLAAEVVVELLTAAARDASSRLATREAINHYRYALERAEDPRRRSRIMLDLGRELEHSGQLEEAKPYLDDAAATALAEDDLHLLARVALTAHRHPPAMPGSAVGAYDAASLLPEAHRRLVGDGAAEATETTEATEATEPTDAAKTAMVRELVAHAEQLARRDADDEALMFILWLRHDTAWGLGTAAERLALISELRELAKRTGDRDTDIFGRSFTWVALLELGDPLYLDQSTSFVSAAERLDLPRYQLSTVVDRGIVAGFRGNFDEAEHDMEKFVHLAEHGPSDFAVMTHHLRWALSVLRGQFDRIDLQLAELTTTDHPFLELAIAITAAERGDAEAALRHGTDIRARADTYPRYLEPLLLRVQAQVAAMTRDEAWAAEIRQALLPHQGEWLVSMYGCDISGSVDHWLALLAVSFGRWDEATHHAAAAVTAAERLGSRPWALKARVLLAEALAGAGDAVAASRVESEARREAQALDMIYVLGKQPAIVPRATTETAPATDPGDPDYRHGQFRREGAVWRLRYDGLVVHLPDAKGLRDVHTLLSLPYQDIPAVRLLEPADGAEIVAARGLVTFAVLAARSRLKTVRVSCARLWLRSSV